MKIFRRTVLFALTILLAASAWSPAFAQQGSDTEYFSQTGHNLRGDFLRFYHAITDPTTIYGYPITEEFVNKQGLKVQYFQRARFEWHPDLPGGQQVVLTDLGRQLYTPGVQLNVFSPFACRLFQQTGFSVCFAFLDFFDNNGGVAQFGNPISPFEYHDGVIVQYFERARLEWQPSKPEGQRVMLTDLGRMYFDKAGEDQGLLSPVPAAASNISTSVTALQVRAFVWKAVTLANNDQQLVFIITQDQHGSAVQGVACTANVRWPDQHTETIAGNGLTNSNGVVIIPLFVNNQPYGNLVFIDITCNYSGLVGTTTTSFRIWY